MNSKGVITTLVLVFGAIFLLLLSGLLGFILLQLRQTSQRLALNQSLHAAEAGIDYYRWRLRHFPDDLQDGQDWCCESPPCSVCGPYEHSFSDTENKVNAFFSLEIEGNVQCGQTSAVVITSTGWTEAFSNTKRKIAVKYAKSTVADFAYLLNDNVWAGSDREIKGPYHSNFGIRMDGQNNALVSSAKETWICTDSFGCDPCPGPCSLQGSDCVCPGVFNTANGNEELFRWPVPPFDFEGITMDLAQIKDITKNQGLGVYIPASENQGYYVILNNRVIDVYDILELDAVYAYDLEQGWHWEQSQIAEIESVPESFAIDESCGLVFIEDNIWVSGEILGKLTLVSADLEESDKETNIWLTGDITYKYKDGTDGLVLLAQNNVLVGLDAPDSMELCGIYIAQKGHFGRNHYSCWDYPSDCIKEYLEIFGSVVSQGRVGTKWSYSWGGIASGFEQRENIFDPKQGLNPPAFLPCLSDVFELGDWQEL